MFSTGFTSDPQRVSPYLQERRGTANSLEMHSTSIHSHGRRCVTTTHRKHLQKRRLFGRAWVRSRALSRWEHRSAPRVCASPHTFIPSRIVWPHCSRSFQGLLALFAEYFAPFDRSTCTPTVSGPYSTLQWIHLALQSSIPKSSTRRFTEERQSERASDKCQHNLPKRAVTRVRTPFQAGHTPLASRTGPLCPTLCSVTSWSRHTTGTRRYLHNGSRTCAASSLAVTEAIKVIFLSTANWYA